MEKEFQRWTARRKVDLLLQLIKGEATLQGLRRLHSGRNRAQRTGV
jgi:hypothetical protein